MSTDAPPSSGSAYDEFIAYRVAIMQAIALAWRDKGFLARLKEDPKRALKTGVGYDFPFNMDLGIDVDNATWEPITVADWRVTKRNTVRLVLPQPPQDANQRIE